MSIDPSRAAGLRSGLLGQLAKEHQAMLNVVRHAPEEKLGYKPEPRMRSFGELAHHIYLAGPWFAGIMEKGSMESGGGEGPPTPGGRDALISACETLHRDFTNRINALSPDALARVIEFPGEGPYPAITFLGWHLNHLIHHRGQLTVYLRLMGARVPPVYGPTLDYPAGG